MKQGARCATVSLALLLGSVAVGPGWARAEGGHDRQPNGHGGAPPAPPPAFVAAPVAPRPPTAPRPFVPGPTVARPHGHRPSRPSAFGFPVYVPSSPSLGSDVGYTPQTPYNPAMFYVPPEDVAAVPPPISVMEFPTGRYELRGDGVVTPYMWVWVPTQPPAPPEPPAPPAGPPAASLVPPVPAAPPGPSAAPSEIYRFTDDQGVVNWTDRWDSIPERYRSHARPLPL